MRLQRKMNMAKWVLGVLCVSMFGVATLAEAGPRHPTVRRNNGGGGVYQRSVPMASYQNQRAYQVQQPVAQRTMAQQPVVWAQNPAPSRWVVSRPVMTPQAPVTTQVAIPVQSGNYCE